MRTKKQPTQQKERSTLSILITLLLFFSIAAGGLYCAVTIQKGIIRQAIIEALEQTRVKL
jgi:hypothetical protein